MENVNRKRITWIDMARGYGILLVIFAHLYVGPLHSWIYSFHLPLFFFLSGYLFKTSESFLSFLIKKIKSLLIPYIFLGLPVIIFYTFSSRALSIPGVIDIVMSFIFQQKFLNIWFITCLFILEIVFYFVSKYIKSDLGILLISVLSVLIGYVFYQTTDMLLYWNADTCLMALPFYSVGYILRKKGVIQKCLDNLSLSFILFVSFVFINLIFWYVNYRQETSLNMFYNSYGIIPATYLSAFAGIFFMIIISNFINIDIVNYIGRNSMIYFVLHQYVIFPVINYIFDMFKLDDLAANVLPGELAIHSYLLVCIVKTVITCIVLTALNKMISETKLKFILGK